MKFEWKVLTGFFVAVAVLAVLGAYSYRNSREYVATSKMVTHTNEVLFNLERVLVATLDIEVGQRGFELTGDKQFLEPYTTGKAVVFDHLASIRALTRDNARQQKKVDTLEMLIVQRSQFSIASIESTKYWIANRTNSTYEAYRESQLHARTEAKIVMDRIRIVTESIRNEEERMLAERMRANQEQIVQFNATFVGLLLFITLLLIAVYITVRINLTRLRRSEEKEKGFRNLLESSIESQKDVLILSIDTHYRYLLFNSSHKRSTFHAYGVTLQVGMNLLDTMTLPEDKIRAKVNFGRALAGESHFTVEEFGKDERYFFETYYSPIYNEEREIIGASAFSSNITERKHAEEHLLHITEDLRVANTELDSFCYSVSHDLRAPLRSINGYSKILLEDYGDRLDTDGKATLGVVMNNARKMGQLIDDLLNFSQIGKTTLASVTLEMDRMANETVKEQLDGKANKITMNIHALRQSVGDPGMMKQVWTNLVSNAIKYSGKIEFPKIEIGCRQEEGSIVYYVKDNGVGFDMTYAHKLFGVFQRLHKSADFEGTGVGLSIINRIILRHGGKVWAEGKPNEGATFYFSLPN